MIVSDSKR